MLIIASIFEKDQLNVFDAASAPLTKAIDVENALKRYRQEALDAGVKTVATVLRDGEPGKVIVRDIIPLIKPNLVVIGAHSKRTLSDRYFGTQSAECCEECAGYGHGCNGQIISQLWETVDKLCKDTNCCFETVGVFFSGVAMT